MIRINLLGRERPKVYRPIQLTGPWVGLLFLFPVIVAGMAIYVHYGQVATKNENLQAQINKYERELKEMVGLQQKMDEVNAQEARVQGRIRVIEELERNQAGPALLLDALGTRVSNTDSVWLTEVTELTGGQIEIKGNAGSVEAVANLISNLERSEFFSDVGFRQSKQVKSGQDFEGTFEFTVTVIFAVPVPETEETPAATTTAIGAGTGR